VKDRIAEFIREKAYKPMTFEELAEALGYGERQLGALRKTLAEMESAGEIIRTRTERYGAPERMNLAVGRLQGHPKGFGFLIPDTAGMDDIFIGREGLNGAWHGDRVIVRLSPPTRADGRMEGEVIRILVRANQRVVGTYDATRHMGFVSPDDRRLTEDIFIPKGATNGARHGEKVVVQVVHWGDSRRNAEGRIVERLGMKGEVGVDILSVIRKHGLPEVFPPRVLAEAEAIPSEVTPEAIHEPGRVDLRDWTIVTIDGEDAKDLDDAVSVEQLGEGRWRLGVHIADVAYYVKEGSALDQEAYKRGTSVYLADRVVPMLPPRLSNGICSLNPHVDRLTLSCVMEINREGMVVKYEIFPSVIRTTARMTYSKVNQILDGDPAAIEEYRSLVPLFLEMRALMEVLKRKRDRRGAIDFDLPEAKVKLNEQGWPVEIRRIDRGLGERIIEEFMLVANETVAEHLLRHEAPALYRVHEEPATDKLAGLKDFLGLFGYTLRLPRDGKVTPKQFQEITHWAQGRTEENLINHVLLRTMKQAVYSERSLGHFGLAADYYCHFTSPIRRYPDLVVHRTLRALMAGELTGRLRSRWEKKMPEMGRHTSERERAAMEAERETVELKKAEFMSDKVGETFEGIISGVTQFGFFVQLPNTVEGLVHVSTLTDDYYHFHDRIYALVGERTRRRFRLGDPVVVTLRHVDVETHQIDFVLSSQQERTAPRLPELRVGEEEGRRAKRRKKRRRGDEGQSVESMEVVEATPVVEETVVVAPPAAERAPGLVLLPGERLSGERLADDRRADRPRRSGRSTNEERQGEGRSLERRKRDQGAQALERSALERIERPVVDRSAERVAPERQGRLRDGAEQQKRQRPERQPMEREVPENLPERGVRPRGIQERGQVRHLQGQAPSERREQGALGRQRPEPPTWRRRAEPPAEPLTHRQAARVSRVVDMWGIPVPPGRVRPADEVGDPTVIAPFSLPVARGDRRKEKLTLTNWDEAFTPTSDEIIQSLEPEAAPVTEREELSEGGRPRNRRRRYGRRRSGNRGGGSAEA
jgi:ribonuclease R